MPMTVARRVLAGVRFLDGVTGLAAGGPLRVRSSDVEFTASRGGVLAVRWARGFDLPGEAAVDDPLAGDYVDPEPALAATDFEIEAWDPAERYVPRRFVLTLPRRVGAGANALETLLEVTMMPAPTARLGHNWAAVRGRVVDQLGDPIGGALVLVREPPVEEPGDVIARGLTAPLYHPSRPGTARRSAGEFLIPVAGIPVTTWGDGSNVFGTERSVVVQVMVDSELPATSLPDPDDIERLSTESPPGRIKSVTVGPIALAVGRHVVVSPFTIDLSDD